MARKTIVALGDSITSGWPYEKEFSWVKYIETKISGAKVINSGVSGDTFVDMLARFDKDVKQYNPDYCIVMGGTNEAYQKIPQSVLKNNFLKLMDKLIEINTEIIVGLPLPVVDVSMERYLIDVRGWFLEYCKEHNHMMIDFYSSMLAADKQIINYDLTLDGCHPNKEGYIQMGQFALAALKELKII